MQPTDKLAHRIAELLAVTGYCKGVASEVGDWVVSLLDSGRELDPDVTRMLHAVAEHMETLNRVCHRGKL